MGAVHGAPRSRSLGLAGALLLLSLLCGACVGTPGAGPNAVPAPVRSASGPPAALTSLAVNAAPGDQQLVVSWQYATTGTPATGVHLDLLRASGSQQLPAGSTNVDRNLMPNRYVIPMVPGRWLVRATPMYGTTAGPATTSNAVDVANSCTAADFCARVTTRNDTTKVRLAAQGFMDGATDWSGNVLHPQLVTPLRPKLWRFAGPISHDGVSSLGATRMQMLSDLWNSATAGDNAGYARTPWSNWDRWTSFVANTVRAAERDGWAPDYWDVWNEPNGTCCPRFNVADQETMTTTRWLQTYIEAWKAIKRVDPNAKVVGPSLSDLQWAPGGTQEFTLGAFLEYSAAHGVVWDAVSWHESNAVPGVGDILGVSTNVDRHLAIGKALLARYPGTVAGNAILVNEYGAKDRHLLAGWAVAYFRSFEDAGIKQANRSCWTQAECKQQLDGLLTAAGQPTALWWAHRSYADLTAGVRMNVGTSRSWELDGLATRDDTTETVRVLLGRHWGCNRPVNPWCGQSGAVPPATLSVTIDWPYGTAPVTVTATRLAAGTTAVATPPVVSSTTARPQSGKLTVPIGAVADGDAISVVAR